MRLSLPPNPMVHSSMSRSARETLSQPPHTMPVHGTVFVGTVFEHSPSMRANRAALAAMMWILSMSMMAIALGQPPTEATVEADVFADRTDAFFETQVRPILANRCWSCHSGEAGESKGSLRLDHGSLILAGGDSGPAVVAGNLEESLIYQAINYQGYEMPPDGRMPAEEIAVLKEWIERGARWPDEPLPKDSAEREAFDLEARRTAHWVWQPRRTSPPPVGSVAESTDQGIDRFIRERLREKGLEPNPTAPRNTLIRRVYLDLVGIPPTADELQRWLASEDPEWYESMVDGLLANPQFGVRWARHWLDLVRFAQSRGHEFDEDIPDAEPYRDYVVRALNANVPYDRFLIEHVAGDLLAEPRRHPTLGWNESVLGTGFWHLGEWVHSPVDARKDETDRFDNMVDVFSKTFLGMTVACARCHDHKFDAISQADYYAMYGYLRSSDYRLIRYETDLQHRTLAQELNEGRSPLRQQSHQALQDWVRPWLVSMSPDARAAIANDAARWEPIAKRIALDRTAQQSRLPLDDPRVHFDARRPDPTLWQSDSVLYGPTSQSVLELSCNAANPAAPWNVHRLTEGQRDPFWNPMSQTSPGVNRQNRYAQVAESGRILPTAKFRLESGKLSYLVRGAFRAFAAIDSHRLIAGPLHGETLLDSDGSAEEYRWVTHSLDRYRGKVIHLEFSPLGDKPFAIVQVIDGPAPAWNPTIPTESPAIAAVISQSLDAAKQWLDAPGSMSEEDQTRCASLLNAIVQGLPEGAGPNDPAFALQRSAMQPLAERWRAWETELASRVTWQSQLALAMRDGSGINDHLLIRGNHARPGDEVPRRNLESLGGNTRPYQGTGSGRLALAQELVAPDNPLVARVIVNRLWHHLTGRGIAPTTDDLGVLGVAPTHPELLDYLAEQMIRSDWSMKKMIRAICLSNTYRQDSRASERSAAMDPNNEWLSYARVRRLEAEAIRDSMLAIAGQLDLSEHSATAPSIPVHLTEFLEGRGRPGRNGPVDGAGRRSLYLEVRRNFLNPMMTTFDTPSPFSTMGRRNVSNVPAQSLILLNDPFVHLIADRWADAVVQSGTDDAQRIRQMMLAALSREPTEQELELVNSFLRSPDFATPRDAYRSWAHMLFNSKELLFRF
jgi:hypothetical protein